MPVPINVSNTPPELIEEAVEAGREVLRQYIAYSVGFRPNRVDVRYDSEKEDFEVSLDIKQIPVQRLRRITGYLSNLNNFNVGKKAEEKDRVKHMRVDKS